MIYKKIDAAKYKEDFKKKFENFGDKAPIMLSFATDDLGVTVVHENTNIKYFYEWDFTIPVKTFIHNIKQELSFKHYPRISRDVVITRPLNSEESAELIEKGTQVDDLPKSITYEERQTFRIDKILAMKDEFIIINESTGEQFCYKMNCSSIYFLKNYRSGAFSDPLEAGNYFFEKSTKVATLDKVNI